MQSMIHSCAHSYYTHYLRGHSTRTQRVWPTVHTRYTSVCKCFLRPVAHALQHSTCATLLRAAHTRTGTTLSVLRTSADNEARASAIAYSTVSHSYESISKNSLTSSPPLRSTHLIAAAAKFPHVHHVNLPTSSADSSGNPRNRASQNGVYIASRRSARYCTMYECTK